MTQQLPIVSKKYDFLANFYDVIWRAYTIKTIGTAISFSHLRGDERVCDIGCGTGPLELALLSRWPGLYIEACDISSGMIARASEKLSGYSQVNLVSGDFLRVPFVRASFDIAFSLSNLHYFPDPQAVFTRVADIVKPDGHFILIDWCRGSFRSKFYETFMRTFDKGFRKTYSMDEVSTMLGNAGFRVEAHDFFSVRGYWQMMVLKSRLR